MKTIEYRTIDKSSWAKGPWQDEPDKVQWQDPTTGLACLIVRGPIGALCGYVGVPPGHEAFGRDYDSLDLSAHGGLTFAHGCSNGPEATSICHLPEEGEPDGVWWLGFDCAHGGDLAPSPTYTVFLGDTYRDLAYVKAQVAGLAHQLKSLEAVGP